MSEGLSALPGEVANSAPRAVGGGLQAVGGGLPAVNGGLAAIDGGLPAVNGGLRAIDGGLSAVDGGLRAVLWDMDGTLVDTEPSWIAAEYRLVESFGGSWTDEHAHALVGNPLLVSAAYLREHGGVELPLTEIVDRLLAEVVADVEREVVWRPGVRRLLAELRAAEVPCAMVTMSYQVLAQSVADRLPAATFATLVTGDQVSRGKPDPEAYLTAAHRLGVPPSQCLAIEDSPAGVASAEAAGCVVLAVQNQVPLAGAPGRTVLDDLAAVTLAELAALVADSGF